MFGRSNRPSDDQPPHESEEGLSAGSRTDEPAAPGPLQTSGSEPAASETAPQGDAEVAPRSGPAPVELIAHIEDELARLREAARGQAEADRLAHERVAEAQAFAEEAKRSLEAEQRAHEQTRSESAGTIESLTGSISALEARTHELEERAGALEAERDALREERNAEPAGDDPGTAERIAELESREQELSSELARARRSLVEAGAHITQLKHACAEAQRTRQEHAGADGFNALRRRRLAGVRNALQARGQQMLQVKHALERKAEQLKEADTARSQAEQLLFEARERRNAAERVYQGLAEQKARSGTGVFVGSVAIAWAVLVCGAWFGVDRNAPTTHEAAIALEADARGTADPDEASAMWSAFATGLPEDPQFLEFAARRLKARSYEALATPGSLRTALAERSEWQSNAPGQLTILMNEVGEERSARVLDALGTAVVAYANDTRNRRADGLPAAIVVPAEADPTPIDDTRTALFGAIAGALTAVLLAFAVFAWRGMRKTIMESTREAFVHADAAQNNALGHEREGV